MRMFPVLHDAMFRAVPWDMVAPHEARAKRNHDQSLERLAQRGGLSPLELVCVLSDRGLGSIRHMDAVEARNALIRAVSEYQRKEEMAL